MEKINSFKKPDDEDISYLIWQLTKIWQRGRHKTLGEFGITASQLEVLGAVYHLQNDVEITQITLSQQTNIDPMTVSTILRNLEKKKLITREGSKTDTRAIIVELTESGQSLLMKAYEKVQILEEYVFKNLDQKSFKEQLKLLLSELNKLEIK